MELVPVINVIVDLGFTVILPLTSSVAHPDVAVVIKSNPYKVGVAFSEIVPNIDRVLIASCLTGKPRLSAGVLGYVIFVSNFLEFLNVVSSN